MKKLFALVLMFALFFTIGVSATDTDLATETDLAETPTEVIETPTDVVINTPEELIGAVIDFIPDIKETTESDLDGVIVGAADIAVAVESGEIPSATDIDELIETIKTYLASLEIKEDAAGVGQYIKDTLMPVIFQVLTSVAAIYGVAYPILLKMKSTKKRVDEAASKFSDAAADVKEAIAEKKAVTEMQGEITALKEASANMVETIRALKAENEGLTAEVKQLTGPVNDELSKIVNAIKIGLCNTQELVNNGYAAKIIKELDGGENVQVEDEVNPD